jgi:epoxyqueuosine reductase
MTASILLTGELKSAAQRLGFDLVGIAPAVTPAGLHDFLRWLDRGYAGEMAYLSRREPAYHHPRHVLDGVRSVVMLGMNYNTVPRGAENPTVAADDLSPGAVTARVSRYAWGNGDYHDLIRRRLHDLAEFVRSEQPGCTVRGIVDTAPLLERDFGRLAGLGWFGKNTMLINKRLGSWFFLAGLLTDLELEYDAPHDASHCGTCTRCLDACPTDAFVEPYVLDARKCISYLTIEHRGPIPVELREGIGDWLFGCDVCQDVCPWNRKAPVSNEPAFQPRQEMNPADAIALFSLTEEQFRDRFNHTPLARPKRAGLLRNAAIVLGNSGDDRAGPALIGALDDESPLVRGAAAWALGQFDDASGRVALNERLAVEADASVRHELESALHATATTVGSGPQNSKFAEEVPATTGPIPFREF